MFWEGDRVRTLYDIAVRKKSYWDATVVVPKGTYATIIRENDESQYGHSTFHLVNYECQVIKGGEVIICSPGEIIRI